MKNTKAIIALSLVLVLICMLFASCKRTKQSTTPMEPQPDITTTEPAMTEPAKTEEPVETKPEPAEQEPQEPKTYSPEEYTDIVMYYFDLRMVGADFGEHVVKAINDYIGPKYGIQVDVQYFMIQDYISKVQMNIAAGEQVDLTQLAFMNSASNLFAKNMLLDITDLMEEYAPDALELVKDLKGASTFNGRLYGVPTLRPLANFQFIIMRKDILEELGMLEKAQNMKSWTEFEEILAAVHDNYTADTGLWALSKESERSVEPKGLWESPEFADIQYPFDLSDNTKQAAVFEDGKVFWIWDDPRMEAKLQLIKKWKDNGWIYPDSALIDTHGDELMKQGVAFAEFTGSEYGVEAVKGDNCGHEVVCVPYVRGIIKTAGGFGLGVPTTAEEPEAACRMINALYTDAELMNIITRGVEGVDYELVDNQVKYPEEPHYYEAEFLIGNAFLLHPLHGQGADFYDKAKQIDEEAEVSPFVGFGLNTQDLSNEIAALSACKDQYYGDLLCGNYTPELLADYKAALEAGGVHTYLDEIQRQLDAYLAAQQ